MSVITQPPDFRVPRMPVRRFTVDEYHRMIQTGILGEDEDVELLAGQIIPKMSRNAPHGGVLGLTDDLIRSRLPANWKVRVQCAITTADSEPEPDIAVVRGPLARYFARHPKPEDVGLVVEVAESSLERDRQEKGPIYATAIIPYYWIVNTVDRIVEVYSNPVDGLYVTHADYGPGQEVPLVLDGQQVGGIQVDEIFGGL